MSMAPEWPQVSETFLDGVAPTIDTIMALPQGRGLRVWDPKRKQMALVFRNIKGRLKIRTGDLEENPEEYDIKPSEALKNALEQWQRAKEGEAQQNREAIESGPF